VSYKTMFMPKTKTMRQLYDFLDVDPTYTDPIFTQRLNSPPENMLKKTGFLIQAFGQEIPLYAAPSSIDYIHQRNWDSSHIRCYKLYSRARLADSESFDDLRRGDISFYTHGEHLKNLSSSEVEVLFTKSLAEELCSTALSWWSEAYNEVEQKSAEDKITELPEALEKELLRTLGPNLHEMYKIAPGLEEKWNLRIPS
jgi:hypothetical protein